MSEPTIKQQLERLNALVEWHDDEKYNELFADDMVNKPSHYVIHEGLEWIDIRESLAQKLMREGKVLPYEDYSDWDRALEYLVRAPWKNGIEDYQKAQFYLNRLVKRMKARSDA